MTEQTQYPCRSLLFHQWIPLLDQLNLGAFTLDLDRRIISFNQSLTNMTGLQEEEVLGRDCREVFRGVPCRERCPFPDGRSVVEESMEVELMDANEDRRLVTRVSTPLYGSDRTLVGCLTILQDHSLLADLINRVNYDARSLKLILDNLSIGIFTVNRGGHITFFNRAAELILGYERQHILGRPASTIMGNDEHPDRPNPLDESMDDGLPRTDRRLTLTSQTGEAVPVRADCLPLNNDQGRIIGGLTTLQDLTLAERFNQVVTDRYTYHNMVGKCPRMLEIFDTVRVVAASNGTILIEGPTGTGKDLLAKVIHQASPRAEKPFVKVNCAALPENLLESELFGYVKGAFTGADRDKPGRFQLADGGTIFLDEIGDLPLVLQAKLLRVLDDMEFYPLGSRRTIKVNVRIISATNQSLERLVVKKMFREDLFYRLNVLRIELPSLRERRPDLPLLIGYIMRKLCAENTTSPCTISSDAMEMLLNYDYPGNIRELENILEYALIICQDDMIQSQHLKARLKKDRFVETEEDEAPPARNNNGHTNGERDQILCLLKKFNWHREKTAEAMGMNRSTLWRKMKRYGLLQ